MTRRGHEQVRLHCVTIESLVPQDHLLRKVDAIVDFTFIYDETQELYCADNGRPSIDPVMLVKYLLVGYLYGIDSERRIEQEIQVNMAYRWFLGLDIDGKVPDHSTISQNRRRRFDGKNLYRRLFERVLALCMEKDLVDGKLILTDSTHVKASASRNSEYKIQVEKEAAWYMERLDRYEAQEREALEHAGKIQPKKQRQRVKKELSRVEKTVSATDPAAGMLNRPGKPAGMHYLDHQSLDAKNGIIVDVAVTPGNVTDAAPYLDRITYMREHIGLTIEAAGADSAYDISLVHQELSEKGIRLITPVNEEMPTYKAALQKGDFGYDEKEDSFICPQGKSLLLRRLQRSENTVSREYRADTKDCKKCPLRDKCLTTGQTSRRIQVNIFDRAVRENHRGDRTAEHKTVLDLRQIWCEGTFAAQKARHNLRGLFRRGREAAEDHCLLSATAMNLKRMIRCLG